MDQATAAQLLQEGLAKHRAGLRQEALACYDRVLCEDPQNADALYYVAVVRMQEGRTEDGVALARQAIGFAPKHARLHNLLGQGLLRLEKPQEALTAFSRAAELEPDFADAHGNRAAILAELGRPQEALAGFDRALALRPDSAEDWCNRANVLADLVRPDDALASLDRALALRPDWAAAHFNRGNMLKDLKRFDQALAAYERALALDPGFVDAHTNSGFVLRDLGRLDEALARLDHAAALRPDLPQSYQHRGNVLREAGRWDAALADYSRALAIEPQFASAHVGLALIHLTRGDWTTGWQHYEHRVALPEPAYWPLAHPRWSGEPLPRERLVLMTEQGLGDALQFCRFAPLLAGRGYDVTLLATQAMRPLLASLAGVTVIGSPEELSRDPRPVRWLPLMSVPGVLGIAPDSVPADVPYLSADATRSAKWAERLGAGGFKIGINWASGPSDDWYRRKRDIALSAFAPLAAIPGVRLISLQKGAAAGELAQVPFGSDVTILDADSDPRSNLFLDTAAAMTQLDLIVTCDTAVAHLAGALARLVFTALPAVTDWRWGLDREDSPWYPTMRVFRQRTHDDWSAPMAQIAAAVREAIGSR